MKKIISIRVKPYIEYMTVERHENIERKLLLWIMALSFSTLVFVAVSGYATYKLDASNNSIQSLKSQLVKEWNK